MNYHIPKLVIPECKGWGSGGEQYKQVVSVPVHSVSLVALQRRAGTLYYWSVYIAMYNTHSTSFSYTFHVQRNHFTTQDMSMYTTWTVSHLCTDVCFNYLVWDSFM